MLERGRRDVLVVLGLPPKPPRFVTEELSVLLDVSILAIWLSFSESREDGREGDEDAGLAILVPFDVLCVVEPGSMVLGRNCMWRRDVTHPGPIESLGTMNAASVSKRVRMRETSSGATASRGAVRFVKDRSRC